MAKIDFSKHDGAVTLSINRRKGIWASSLLLKGVPTTKQAGHVSSSDLSADNLFAIALSNSIRSIGGKQRDQLTGRDRRKPRLLVTLGNSPSAQKFIAGMQNPKESHVSDNFRLDLNRQTSKFDLTFEAEADGSYITSALERWSESVVAPVDFLPKIYQRSAFSQTYRDGRR